jgi:membrane protease YdiL (CAAX protease family)
MDTRPYSSSRRADVSAVVVALVLPTLVTLLYFVLLAGQAAGVQQVAYGIGKVVQFGLPVVWVWLVQRQSIRLTRPVTRGLAANLGFGALVFVAILLLYRFWLEPAGYLTDAAGAIREKVVRFGADTPAKYFALGAFYAVCHSFLEEYYWRWFVFGQLRRLAPLGTAILVSALGFMAHHVLVLATFFGWTSPATWLFSAAVAVGGAVWAWLYHRAGSLYGPWLSHLLVDAGIFTVGYFLVRDLLIAAG